MNSIEQATGNSGSEPDRIRDLVDVRDPRAWIALDLDIRDVLRREWRPWDEPAKPVPLGPGSTERELAVALCHADGRVREAALARVPGVPALLPLVAIRGTDWAAPVRERALALLRTALPALPVQAFCDVAAVIVRVAERRHGAGVLALAEHQLRYSAPDFVARCLSAPERRVRRLAAREAVERELFSPVELARFAAKGSDVTVQDRFAQAAVAALPGEETEAVLALLLDSRQSRVRATGVSALNRFGSAARAEPFLTDRAPVVRACARWVLRQHGSPALPRYRELCSDAGRLDHAQAAAAAGLGECGERADAALLRPLLAHPVPRVRAQAVAGLKALDVVAVAELLPLVDDPDPAVVRAAVDALLPSPGRLPEAWFAARLGEEVPPPTRLAARRLYQAVTGKHPSTW
ncbi:hypothetical protein GCM10010329_72170 [Streptomyces spiroverticillatus]|uniref:HEAT repeat domain-containing protein n=1 Tax=Streptomyces finlayi TaxID=67296 RepID=A0A918X0D8_9ACTN|nr:HEAT repeat domain-containing protein [Streptomyces finlayi]GHA38600.1 hypothetical protein GCM10010329_72170 [Streptomyces spiroverticillatus]GHD00760.1 hypothetical protein GCM10010334_45590 [Streptomyces finlayi]